MGHVDWLSGRECGSRVDGACGLVEWEGWMGHVE